MNNVTCGSCFYFHEMKKFTPRGEKARWYGWCSKKSVYPHTAPEGMIIPEHALRAPADRNVSSPVLVEGAEIVRHCTDMVRK